MTHGQKVRNWILKAFEKEYPDMELISYYKDTDYLHGIRGKIPGAMTINAYEN